MASVNYQKIKTSRETKAKIRHDEKEERKKANHTNPNIDKSLTDTNLSYRFKTLPDGSRASLSYEEVCEDYDRVMKGLDAKKGANKRKDRVTCLSLEIPTPNGMTEDQEEDYFMQLGKIFEEEFEECYLLDGFFHRDEKHAYYDPEDKEYKESRNHATFRYIPIKDGKLNAKATLTRSKMRQVNTRLNEMCMDRYGLEFNTGKGKRGKSVEQLKAETNIAEMKKTSEELESKRKDLQELNDKYNTLDEKYNTLKTDNRELTERYNTLQANHEDLTDKYKALQGQYKSDRDLQAQMIASVRGFINKTNERDAKSEFIKKKGLQSEFVEYIKNTTPNSDKKVINEFNNIKNKAKRKVIIPKVSDRDKNNDGMDF